MVSKYKHGKQKKTLGPCEFAEIIENGVFVKPNHRAFLVLLYYTGCRVSEIIKLTREDFEIKNNTIYVDIKASKKGVERPLFKLRLTLAHIEHLTVLLMKTKKGRVFPFSRQTAWNIVKRVMPEHYPHFFRLNRATAFLNKGWPPNKIRRWFGWKTFKTAENYLGYSEDTMEELSQGIE